MRTDDMDNGLHLIDDNKRRNNTSTTNSIATAPDAAVTNSRVPSASINISSGSTNSSGADPFASPHPTTSSGSVTMGSSTVPNPRVAALAQRRRELEESLRKRNQELRDLCIKEAELIGSMPIEYPLEPGERAPVFQKTGYQLSSSLVNNLVAANGGVGGESGGADESLSQLELELQVLAKMADAAQGLASNQSFGKTVRRHHKSEYDKIRKKYEAVLEKIQFHSKEPQCSAVVQQSKQREQQAQHGAPAISGTGVPTGSAAGHTKHKKKPRPSEGESVSLNGSTMDSGSQAFNSQSSSRQSLRSLGAHMPSTCGSSPAASVHNSATSLPGAAASAAVTVIGAAVGTGVDPRMHQLISRSRASDSSSMTDISGGGAVIGPTSATALHHHSAGGSYVQSPDDTHALRSGIYRLDINTYQSYIQGCETNFDLATQHPHYQHHRQIQIQSSPQSIAISNSRHHHHSSIVDAGHHHTHISGKPSSSAAAAASAAAHYHSQSSPNIYQLQAPPVAAYGSTPPSSSSVTAQHNQHHQQHPHYYQPSVTSQQYQSHQHLQQQHQLHGQNFSFAGSGVHAHHTMRHHSQQQQQLHHHSTTSMQQYSPSSYSGVVNYSPSQQSLGGGSNVHPPMSSKHQPRPYSVVSGYQTSYGTKRSTPSLHEHAQSHYDLYATDSASMMDLQPHQQYADVSTPKTGLGGYWKHAESGEMAWCSVTPSSTTAATETADLSSGSQRYKEKKFGSLDRRKKGRSKRTSPSVDPKSATLSTATIESLRMANDLVQSTDMSSSHMDSRQLMRTQSLGSVGAIQHTPTQNNLHPQQQHHQPQQHHTLSRHISAQGSGMLVDTTHYHQQHQQTATPTTSHTPIKRDAYGGSSTTIHDWLPGPGGAGVAADGGGADNVSSCGSEALSTLNDSMHLSASTSSLRRSKQKEWYESSLDGPSQPPGDSVSPDGSAVLRLAPENKYSDPMPSPYYASNSNYHTSSLHHPHPQRQQQPPPQQPPNYHHHLRAPSSASSHYYGETDDLNGEQDVVVLRRAPTAQSHHPHHHSVLGKSAAHHASRPQSLVPLGSGLLAMATHVHSPSSPSSPHSYMNYNSAPRQQRQAAPSSIVNAADYGLIKKQPITYQQHVHHKAKTKISPLEATSPYDIPAESKAQQSHAMPLSSDSDVYNNNSVPKNCTVVQAGHCKPYQEETKPFEMSDFYKYSTKYKKTPVKQQKSTSLNAAVAPASISSAARNLKDTFECAGSPSTADSSPQRQYHSPGGASCKDSPASLNASLDVTQLTPNVAENFSAEMNAWFDTKSYNSSTSRHHPIHGVTMRNNPDIRPDRSGNNNNSEKPRTTATLV